MTQLSPDNKIINGLWISPDGKPLSNLERLCIYSFCANGHDFRLWTYGDLPNIPKDTAPGKVEICNGEDILPKSEMIPYRKTLANFSDYFRWELMRKIGGWYIDMDMVCLRPLAFGDDLVVFRETRDTVNSAIMKFPKRHRFAVAMADACANPNKIVLWDSGRRRRRKMLRALQFWGDVRTRLKSGEAGGPPGFTHAAKHFGIFADAMPTWPAMFISCGNVDYLLDGELHKAGILQPLLQYAHAMHFWHNGLFQKGGNDKNGVFHPDSPYEVLKHRYLPEFQ